MIEATRLVNFYLIQFCELRGNHYSSDRKCTYKQFNVIAVVTLSPELSFKLCYIRPRLQSLGFI